MDYEYMDKLEAENARLEMKKIIDDMTDEQARRFVKLLRRHKEVETFLTLLKRLS